MLNKIKKKWKNYKLPVCYYCEQKIEKQDQGRAQYIEKNIRFGIMPNYYWGAEPFHLWCIDLAKEDGWIIYDYDPKERKIETKRNKVEKAKNIYLNAEK